MPIYEYRCESCGTELERLQKISDPALTECPECGKDTLTKLISASSFRLKGSGWYETDFKTGNKKNGVAEAAAGEGAGSAAKDAGKVDQAAGTAAVSSKTETVKTGTADTGSKPASTAPAAK